MVKKLLLLFAFNAVLFSYSFGQACNPDPTYTTNGIHPDSATGFAPGYANQPYSQLITVVIPVDTTPAWPPVPIPWDSTVLVSIQGLPNGFTYACWNSSNPSYRCSWRGGTTGCAIITGNPTIADTGTYPLTINTNNYLGGGNITQPYVITYYKIRINGPLGIANLDAGEFMVGDCIPNPFTEHTEINFNSPEVRAVTIKVYNIVGTEVFSLAMRAQRGINKFTFDRNALPPGLYVYAVSNGLHTITRKMVISK